MYGQRPNKRQRRIKPVARLGAVDIAVRYDIHNGRRIGNPENRVIHEGELVFNVHGASVYRDNSLHVLADTDGAQGKNVHFAGVAVTGFDPKHDVYEQGFVIQVSGLCSIFNSSGQTILPGQPLYALRAAPASDQLGIRHDKKVLKLSTLPAGNVGFVGTCVRGGRKGTTIDVVLHRSLADGTARTAADPESLLTCKTRSLICAIGWPPAPPTPTWSSMPPLLGRLGRPQGAVVESEEAHQIT